MTRSLRTGLLAGVGAVALVSTAISPASAFDSVNWSWNAHIEETVVKDVLIDIDMVPTGLVMVQDLQISIGDIDAYSEVYGIHNNQPGGQLPQGPQDFQWHYGLGGVLIEDGFESPEIVDANVDETDGEFPPNSGDQFNGTVVVTIDLAALSDREFDAITELPEVISSATAVANNSSITSANPVELHEGQFAFNVVEDGADNLYDVPIQFIPSDNTNLGGAALLTWYALNGSTVPAQVQAISSVDDVLNASVDSSGTAVSNNLNITVDPASAAEALVMADIVQFSHANVYADSFVSNVDLNNYTNLGAIDRPIVSSVATAVGNNKSITVNVPSSTPSVP